MATSQNMMSAKTQYLINKWNRRIRMSESVSGKMNVEKKAALAVTLENTARRLEATQPRN